MKAFDVIERAKRGVPTAATVDTRTIDPSSTPTALTTVLCAAALLLACPSVADVTVREQMTMNFAIIKAHSTNTERIAGDKQRTESDVRCDGMMSLLCGKTQQVDIVRLDRGVTWKVESKKKRYSEIPLPTPEQSRAAAEHMHAAMEKLKSCPAVKRAEQVDTSKCELSQPILTVDKTDEVASIAGHDAKRTNLKFTQTCKSKEAATQTCDLVYSMDLWLTRDEIPGLADRQEFQRHYLAHLGAEDAATSAQLGQYMAPYADVIKQLKGKAEDLKGYPLKSTFRFAFGGASCGAGTSAPAGATGSALSEAGKAAGVAGANSAEQAARRGTIDKVQQSTGTSLGGYVAGSAAGAFADKLVGGLFTKKSKPEDKPPAPDAAASNGAPATIVAELTMETVALNTDPVPADQFEVPTGFTKQVVDNSAEPQMPSCPASTP